MYCPSLTAASGVTLSLSVTRFIFGLLVVCCVILAHFQFRQSQQKGTCRDLEHRVPLSNRTASSTWKVTVRATNPNTPYTNYLTFSYHSDPGMIGLNNAVCQFQVSGVNDMTRSQRQNLKPRIIKEVIRATRSHHVAYVDYDANFVHWPPRPASSLIVQSTPSGNGVNTGGLIFYNARSHLPLLNRWISFETVAHHDQGAWHAMERKSPVPRLTLSDGSFVEHYNWQVIHRRATIRRCRSIIASTSAFHSITTALIVAALIVKFFDTSTWRVRGCLPRRSVVNVAILISIVLCVWFTGDVHRQVGAAAPQRSERVCCVPELALLPDGRLVTRRGTVGDENRIIAELVRVAGMQTASTILSIWFLFLQQLRRFARVFIIVEIASAVTMLITGMRAYPESMLCGFHTQMCSSGHDFAQRSEGKVYLGLTEKEVSSMIGKKLDMKV